MPSTIEAIIKNIEELQDELEEAFATRRAEFSYRVEKSRIVFEADLIRRHKVLKVRLSSFLRHARPAVVLTAPVIYALIIPIALLDLCVTFYQAVCFPIYGIGKVQRHDFIVFDRHRLAYLNGIEKLNCTYCSYANGLFAYVAEIASRTEQYWCPIKHAKRISGAHRHYPAFVDYGDGEGYRMKAPGLRAELDEPPE